MKNITTLKSNKTKFTKKVQMEGLLKIYRNLADLEREIYLACKSKHDDDVYLYILSVTNKFKDEINDKVVELSNRSSNCSQCKG